SSDILGVAMNHTHLPRSLVILLFILVASTFFMGTLRAFVPVRAAIVLDDLAQKADLPTSTSIADFPTPGPTPTPPPPSLLPPPTDGGPFMPTPPPTYTPMPTAIPTPLSKKVYADTTGIIALAIFMVVVILVGVAWGGRSSWKKKEPKK
ncbi:MAG: hypothetical protein NTV38_05830, partial [Chloroflexi bacterium]|nr:hypothetical protein [Chloroflexota bacterium]